MKQAPMFDGMSFDVPTFGEDVLAPAKVDVRWGQIVQALMVALMIVVLDEAPNLGL